MAIHKVRPKPRQIRSAETLAHPPKRAATVVVENSHAQQILHLPPKQRAIVIAAIKEGSSVSDIAMYFSEQGWLRVTENTFKQYLFAFKRVFPEMCEGNDETSIDNVVDAKRPAMDEAQELERLVRLQKVRLKVGVDFERNTGILMKDLHKDVKITGELLEQLASVRGKTSAVGRPGMNHSVIAPEASDGLRKVEVGEAAQDRLVNAMSGLINLVQKNNGKTSSQDQA